MADQKKSPRRRLSLMEAYSSFSDDNLQDISKKIKQIGEQSGKKLEKPVVDQLNGPIGDQVDHSASEMNQKDNQSLTQPQDDQIDQAGDPFDQAVETALPCPKPITVDSPEPNSEIKVIYDYKNQSVSRPNTNPDMISPSSEPSSYNEQSPEQLFEQTDRQSNNQTVDQTDRQTVKQVVRHINRQFNHQTNNHLYNQAHGQSIEHSHEQSFMQLPGQSPKERPYFFWMTPSCQAVLNFLIVNQGNIVRMDKDIPRCTGVPYGTVRNVIRSMKSYGIITVWKRANKGLYYRGSEFQLASMMIERFIREQSDGQLPKQSCEQLTGHSYEQTVRRTDRQTDTLDRKIDSINKNLSISLETNPSDCPSQADSVNPSDKDQDRKSRLAAKLQEPELRYWEIKGLKATQMAKWLDEFPEISENSLIESLKYCRFAMVELGAETGENGKEPIQKPVSYFYKTMQKMGYFPRPKGYKSYEEQDLERRRDRLAEKERQIKELQEIRAKEQEAEQELAFQEMLSNPECEDYQQCFALLPKFTQERINSQNIAPKLLEMSMREAYAKICEQRLQEQLEAARAQDSKPD